MIDSRVFICDHLTQHNLQIYNEYLKLKHAKLIVKISTRKGNAYIHEAKNSQSRPQLMDSIDFLHKKFNEHYASLLKTNPK